MVKEQFQKELKKRVIPGVKPSHLKKLKRSKSADDIPTTPTSVPLTKSKSQEPFKDPNYPYTTLVSQQQTLEKLEKETTAKSDTIALLRKKIEELEKNNPPNALLTEQLTTKQKELENLRKQLEITNQELNSLKKTHSSLLDDNLTLKHQSLKDWWQQYQKTKQLDQELATNIDEASNELLDQDKVIENLRGQVKNLKLTNQSLQKDLNLATKLAELRKNPYYSASNDNYGYLKYALYSLLAVAFTLWLTKSFKNISPHE